MNDKRTAKLEGLSILCHSCPHGEAFNLTFTHGTFCILKYTLTPIWASNTVSEKKAEIG
jgi:hypothetical protein